MRKILAALAVAVALACAPATPLTTVRGTGERGPATTRLYVENDNFNMAKIYIVSAGSSSGFRVASVDGLTTQMVRPMIYAARFQVKVEFLASKTIWISQEWSAGEKCLTLIIRSYVPQSFMMSC